jgi:hypothetical protein
MNVRACASHYSGLASRQVLQGVCRCAFSSRFLLCSPSSPLPKASPVPKSNSNVLFGNLVLTGFTNDLAFLNGMTVRGLLSEANNILGGGPTPDPTLSFEDFDGVLLSVNDSFNGGPAFASFDDQHLLLPPSATAAPEIDQSSVLSGMTLLLRALAALRGRPSARRNSKPSTST